MDLKEVPFANEDGVSDSLEGSKTETLSDPVARGGTEDVGEMSEHSGACTSDEADRTKKEDGMESKEITSEEGRQVEQVGKNEEKNKVCCEGEAVVEEEMMDVSEPKQSIEDGKLDDEQDPKVCGLALPFTKLGTFKLSQLWCRVPQNVWSLLK